MNNRIHLKYIGTCCHKNKIWFFNLDFNGLFSVDLRDFTLTYECKIPFLKEDIEQAYSNNCLAYDNKLFFFPFRENRILVYDISDGNACGITINTADDMAFLTKETIKYGNQVWIFPHNAKLKIPILNLNTLQVEYDEELSRLIKNIDEGFGVRVTEKTETEAIVLPVNGNRFSVIDIIKKKEIYRKSFGEKTIICSIAYNEGSYWILFRNSTDIYEWKKGENQLIKYHLLQAEWIDAKRCSTPYIDMVFYKDQIIILSSQLKYIMRIDKENRIIDKAVDYPEGFRFIHSRFDKWSAFLKYDIIDNKIWLHPLRGNMLLIYDIEKNTIEGKELVVTGEQVPFLQNVMIHRLFDSLCYEEEEFCALENLLEMSHTLRTNIGKKEDIGKKVYDVISAG